VEIFLDEAIHPSLHIVNIVGHRRSSLLHEEEGPGVF